MNFTWFASQFDTDDWLYRVLTLLQMAGVLVLAAGVADVFAAEPDFRLITVGYFVMRVPLIAKWIRAGLSDPAHREAAFRYAGGTALVQVLWLLDQAEDPTSLVVLALAGLVIVFGMWWVYFDHDSAPLLSSLGRSLVW